MPKTPSPKDPALVVSVRDIAFKPGAHKPFTRVVAVASTLGTEVIKIPVGVDLRLDLSLESVSEGIWISGTAMACAVGECARCLNEVSEDIVGQVEGLFVYPDLRADGSFDEADVYDFDGENIDLEEVIRDAVVTSLPFVPLCDPDCPGLCPTCGVRLDDPEHRHDEIDPRWAVLEGLTDTKEK